MSDEMMVFVLVTAGLLAFVVVGSWVVMLSRLLKDHDRLARELQLGYRRATMPALVVPEAGEPDVPLTPEMKRIIDEAYGIDQNSFNAGVVDGRYEPQRYPDPTDALLPDPDPMNGANRVSTGDDPYWPFQDGVKEF